MMALIPYLLTRIMNENLDVLLTNIAPYVDFLDGQYPPIENNKVQLLVRLSRNHPDIAWMLSPNFKATRETLFRAAYTTICANARGLNDWYVVLRLDQVLTRNVEYNIWLALKDEKHSHTLLGEFSATQMRADSSAVAFCSDIIKLGVKVVIVTTRSTPIKVQTDAMLEKLGIPYSEIFYDMRLKSGVLDWARLDNLGLGTPVAYLGVDPIQDFPSGTVWGVNGFVFPVSIAEMQTGPAALFN
jgi:hypothetical protein